MDSAFSPSCCCCCLALAFVFVLYMFQHTQHPFHFSIVALAGITRVTKQRSPRNSRKQLKISYVESAEAAEYQNAEEAKHRRSARSSRRDRVHPEGKKSPRAMDESGKSRSKRLSVQTRYPDEERRANGELRSPGTKRTPIASAARHPSDNQVIPDFITQTDANGNATTPRSADAIQGARKSHPTGRRPKLHVDKRGRLSEDESDDDSEKGALYSGGDPCEMLLDSLRLMCCCFMEDVKGGKSLTGQLTQESADDRPKLLGALHADDHGKKCLVLDLDETLVHSSFRAVPNADFVIPVQVRSLLRRLSPFLLGVCTNLFTLFRLKMLFISFMLLSVLVSMNF